MFTAVAMIHHMEFDPALRIPGVGGSSSESLACNKTGSSCLQCFMFCFKVKEGCRSGLVSGHLPSKPEVLSLTPGAKIKKKNGGSRYGGGRWKRHFLNNTTILSRAARQCPDSHTV